MRVIASQKLPRDSGETILPRDINLSRRALWVSLASIYERRFLGIPGSHLVAITPRFKIITSLIRMNYYNVTVL